MRIIKDERNTLKCNERNTLKCFCGVTFRYEADDIQKEPAVEDFDGILDDVIRHLVTCPGCKGKYIVRTEY